MRFWETLNVQQRDQLLGEVACLDFASITRMQSLLRERTVGAGPVAIEPAPVMVLEDDARIAAIEHGKALLRGGKVGVVIVAGGQGSRLGFEGPKGAYRVGPISDASLFQIHARKVLALERLYGAGIPLYLMTSQANDEETRNFFEENNCFGLCRDRVKFFKQGMWPALTADGRIILERTDHIFVSPDGHGGIISAMRNEGVLQDLRDRGVSTLHYLQVDNPMVDIADPAFVGFHDLQGADVSVKVCAKRDAAEPIGVVALKGGKNTVVEYSDLTDEQKRETLADGSLKFLYGSVAIHAFSLAFLEAQAETDLPAHVAHKKVPFCDKNGVTVTPEDPNAFKFEKFIFDVIPRAACSLNVVFAREAEFSPVKNAEGEDSPATCQRDMTRLHAGWLEECGVQVPRSDSGDPMFRIEIDPLYALNVDALRATLPAGLEITDDLYLS